MAKLSDTQAPTIQESENQPSTIKISESPAISSVDLNALFATAWPDHTDRDFQPVLRHSLAYICAYEDHKLIGFVNLAWDGDSHAFLLDTTVHPAWQRQGVGQMLVLHAQKVAQAKGIEWLHVDYEPHLSAFYRSCGFQPTEAGLINLRQ